MHPQKEITLKDSSETVILKATSSLFVRMLVIAWSSRADVDLEEVIGPHKFSYTNRVLMEPDGSIHPTTDKSTIIHLLENLVQPDSNITLEASAYNLTVEEECCLVVDGMAVFQELMEVKNFSSSTQRLEAVVK